ncbi:MAG: AsmA family protein, partial [Methylophilaceae bacterium]|nr:AsmA family protein [Methylophilaceae bacterium]
ASVTIREISISKAQLVWPDMALPEFNVDVVMTADNKPESAQIATTDGKVKIDLVPEDDRQRITMSAQSWTLPVGVPLLIDRLDSEMMLVDKRLDIQRLDIELYEGKVSTGAVLNWQKNWALEGKLNVSGVQVAKPVSMVSQSTQLSGKLSGDGSYKASTKEPAKLMEQLQANFRFKVLDGVLDGVDLAKAATLLGTKGGMDGQTRFDTLTGMLNVAGKQYHLRNLDIASGLLKATGDVKIKPNKELGGEVKVEIKKGTTLVAIPLQVTGTTEKPMVLPTKAALAGAAAGTAILGPGVGTSLGIQAADKLKGLFGSDED